MKGIRGAVDVVADPIRGKPYIEVRLDRERAARLGVSRRRSQRGHRDRSGGQGRLGDGRGPRAASRRRPLSPVPGARTRTRCGTSSSPPTVSRAGRARTRLRRSFLIRSRSPRSPRSASSRAPRRSRGKTGCCAITSGSAPGAATLPTSSRRHGRPSLATPELPDGVFLEWTGQFEYELRARRTLALVVPVVVALIFVILYWTYHDLADAALMMMAVPGAIAGGLFFQWLLGLKLSVTVWVGYIACFGMATSTGIIMLVYLREAVARAGGLERHEPRRAATGRHGRGRASAPSQAPDRGHGRHRPGPDALVQRGRRPRSSGRWPLPCSAASSSPTR